MHHAETQTGESRAAWWHRQCVLSFHWPLELGSGAAAPLRYTEKET